MVQTWAMENRIKYCPVCREEMEINRALRHGCCPACGFELFLNVAAAVAAIIESDGKVLVTRRGQDPGKGLLDLTGGFIDQGEKAEDGLRREIREELALEIQEIRYLTSFPNTYPYGGIIYHTLDLFFVGRVLDIGAGRINDEELAGFDLRVPDEVNLDEFAFDSIRNGFAYYLENRTGR